MWRGRRRFYGSIAGWQFQGISMEDRVCKDGEEPVGGIVNR
jgi:hypothetical protein